MYIILTWDKGSVVPVTLKDGTTMVFGSLVEAREYAKRLNVKWKIFYS